MCNSRTSAKLPVAVRTILCIVALCSLAGIHPLCAQQKKHVKLLGADVQEFDKTLGNMQRLRGNVRFEYEGTMLYCDSAWLYNQTKDFDAFGNVRIVKGNDYTLTGRKLHLVQAEKIAQLEQDVTLRDRDITLSTNYLRYNLDTRVASYQGGGKIVSKKNNNVLTSREGYYNTHTQVFNFRREVVLLDPDYTVKSDTLQYHELTEVAYFFGPTTITGKQSRLTCENGWYNTRTDVCQFRRNARVEQGSLRLTGDSIYYDGRQGIGQAFRYVVLRDTTKDYFITGHYARHLERSGESWVTRNPVFVQTFESDTLYLQADTMYMQGQNDKSKILSAFHRATIYKSDLQALCDSLVYSESDSTMLLFTRPVLWSNQSQLTGDTMALRTWSGHIDGLSVYGNSFIATAAPGNEFNQLSGRNLRGVFEDNTLKEVFIHGNGQVIYFPEKEKSNTPLGLNQGDCSDIHLSVRDNKIVRIALQRDAASVFHPLEMAPADRFRLPGFTWRFDERPLHGRGNDE